MHKNVNQEKMMNQLSSVKYESECRAEVQHTAAQLMYREKSICQISGLHKNASKAYTNQSY